MRRLKLSCVLVLPLFLAGAANAQNVKILYPQEGQDVRGEITARFEGIPAGGYAQIKIDDQFSQATAQDSLVLDTISDRVTFARGDSAYRLEITVLNSGGKRVGSDSVSFNVANNKVDEGGSAVRLVHWSPQDRLGEVQRYRVFAESNATVSGGDVAGNDNKGSGSYLPSPLDYQVAVLLRRLVRDVNLFTGSANISTIVQEGVQRQRLQAPVTPAELRAASQGAPAKGPWYHNLNNDPLWSPSPETGKYFIKMIQQNGTEVNATRKAPGVAIADLLPTFPSVAVRPGSTWQTNMTFLSDLSSRLPINVSAPITFTAFEELQTPGGESRRCAKLESRFPLPENLAKRIAANLANKVGEAPPPPPVAATGDAASDATAAAQAPAATPAASAPAATTPLFTEADIAKARTTMSRVLWFDVARRRVLRAEDTVRSNFELPPPGATPGVPLDATQLANSDVPVVSYTLNVTTWFDDRLPDPTEQFVVGGGSAHSRDSVNEPGLSRLLRPAR